MSGNVTGIHVRADGNTTEGEQYLAGLRAYITRLSGLIANMKPLIAFSLPEFKTVQQERSKVLVEKAKSTLRFMGSVVDIDEVVFAMSPEQILELKDLMGRVVETHMKALALMLELEAVLAMCEE